MEIQYENSTLKQTLYDSYEDTNKLAVLLMKMIYDLLKVISIGLKIGFENFHLNSESIY